MIWQYKTCDMTIQNMWYDNTKHVIWQYKTCDMTIQNMWYDNTKHVRMFGARPFLIVTSQQLNRDKWKYTYVVAVLNAWSGLMDKVSIYCIWRYCTCILSNSCVSFSVFLKQVGCVDLYEWFVTVTWDACIWSHEMATKLRLSQNQT